LPTTAIDAGQCCRGTQRSIDRRCASREYNARCTHWT